MSGEPPSGAGMALTCHDLSFAYVEGSRAALERVDFSLPAGAALALLGASGAGKSTLLNVIRGLDTATGGEVVLDGLAPNDRGYGAVQADVGIVFQSPEMQLFAPTVDDDVAWGPRRRGWSAAAVEAAVDEALDLFELSRRQLGGRHPAVLSGGEARRVAIAGVLALHPRLLLLDEPFVGLDPASRDGLVGVLERLVEQGTTTILATHDVDLAWRICPLQAVLDDGRLLRAGPWRFDESGLDPAGLDEPFLVQLWRRLGRPVESAPRTLAAAAEALT